MIWYIALEHPKREPLCFVTEHLGPTVCRAVSYGYRLTEANEWRELTCYHTGLFIEEYTVYALDLLRGQAKAYFSKLRRSHELARHFDPRRLPT